MASHENRRPTPTSEMNRLDLRKRAFNLIKEKSFFRGEFKLASGKVSNYYLDMKPTMFDPEGSHALSELIIDRLRGTEVELVGGLAVGAVPLVANVSQLSFIKGWPLPSFFVRKEVKSHGTKKVIEGTSKISGKTVVILDDVTTTGESANYAVEAARAAGAKVSLVLAIVDRLEGASDFYAKENVPFASLFTAEEFLNS